MRIVIVSDYAVVNGGAAKVALMSAQSLAERGHEVLFVGGSGEAEALFCNVPGLTIETYGMPSNHEIPIRQRLSLALWNPEVDRRVRKSLAGYSTKDTVVHIHSYRDVLSVSAVTAVRDLGYRTVFTAHEFRLTCPTGEHFNRQTQQICPLSGGSLACWGTQCTERGWAEKAYQNLRFVRQRSRGNLPGVFDHIVFVSEFSRKIMVPNLPGLRSSSVITNPVEFSQPEPASAGPDAPLLFIGRLSMSKDPVLAARAAKEVGIPIRFVGDGPLRGEVQAANPDAELLGWQTPDQVRAHLQSARALLFTSRWYETQGLVVLEAIANGVPVLCADTTAASDILTEYGGGFLLPAQDLAGLVEKLTPFQDPTFGEELGRSAYRRFWASPPTMENHAHATEALYARLLEGPQT